LRFRRLRAALTLFKPHHLEPHATPRFEAELRRVGQVEPQRNNGLPDETVEGLPRPATLLDLTWSSANE
jgi:hypothetical protein